MSFHPAIPYGTKSTTARCGSRCRRAREFPSPARNEKTSKPFASHYAPQHRKSAILHALYLAQEQQGYITNNALRHVAEVSRLHLPPKVEDVCRTT
jgi:NADH:ubiquinone oxidoreductase subunit E